MLLSMILMSLIYVAAVYWLTEQSVAYTEQNYNHKVQTYQDELKFLTEKKEKMYKEKLALEGEAIKIFTLYEITKDITRSLNQEGAFEIFKTKIKDHIHFTECLFLDPFASEVNDLRRSNDYFIFTLQGKKRRIGYLAFKDVSQEDKEKVLILGHQFALALRRVTLYQEIEKIAITDSLSNLHTRRYVMERYNEELDRSKMRKMKMSVVMLDVDHFKQFNDRFGHLAGDQILREVGQIIKDNIREIDIAGRFGGEEFCIVLPETDSEGAKFAAERIRQAAEKAEIQAYDNRIRTTVSLGIATFPKDGSSTEELIDRADWALYRAKNTGRNRVEAYHVYEK